MVIFLPQPLKCQDHKHEAPHLALKCFKVNFYLKQPSSKCTAWPMSETSSRYLIPVTAGLHPSDLCASCSFPSPSLPQPCHANHCPKCHHKQEQLRGFYSKQRFLLLEIRENDKMVTFECLVAQICLEQKVRT